MKKRVEILVYHLGYGGIEKAVSSLVDMLKDNYELSILSFYRLYDNPVFKIDPNVSINYLYDTNVPLKVKKYNQCLRKKEFGKLFKLVFLDYFKKLHIKTFFHDLFMSLDIYFFKGRFRRLKKHLKNSNHDIYISTRYEISDILGKYGNSKSLKIGWEHNHHHGDFNYKKCVVEASKNLNNLVLVSRGLTKDYQKELAMSHCKCVYIPNVIDYALPFVSDYREKRILMVGRLEAEKGIFDAIEVAKRLQERMLPFHLDIIGDGPLRNELELNVQKRNLASHISFHGFQSHDYIHNLYKHASLYLMTSYTESFGLVLLEAMNAGIPCLAFSSAEGALELIQNDTNGYLIDGRNLDEMATTIELLLKRPEKITMLGRNAKAFSQNFLPSSVRVMWTNLLDGEKL